MSEKLLKEYQALLAQQQRNFGISPDKAAKDRKTANALKVPVQAVQDSPDNAYIQASFEKVWNDTQGLGTLRGRMTDSNFHSLANDDTAALSKTEKASVGFGEMRQGADDPWYRDLYRSIRRGFYQGKAAIGLGVSGMDIFGLDSQKENVARAAGVHYDQNINRAAQYRADMRRAARFSEDLELQKAKQGLAEVNQSGSFAASAKYLFNNPMLVLNTTAESVGRASPQLAATAAAGGGNPFGVAATAGLGSLGNEYAASIVETMEEKASELGGMSESEKLAYVLSREDWMNEARKKAFKRGVSIAAFDAATAGVAGRLIAGAKGGVESAVARTVGEAGIQAAGGMAGEATAQLVTGEFKPADILLEGFAEIPTGTVEARANYREARARAGHHRAEKAQANAEHMREQAANASESKLTERAPDVASEFINDTYPDTSKKIYIDSDALLQTGVSDKLISAVPDYAADIQEALQTGGMVELTRGQFHAELPSEVQSQLIDYVRETPDAMSAYEASQWQENEENKAFEDAFSQSILQAQQSQVFESDRALIQENIFNQLMQTGRFTEEQAKQNALLAASGYAAQAQRYGVDIGELFRQMPLNVVGESVVQDGVFSQNAFESDADKVYRALQSIGIDARRESSRVSNSEYIYANIPLDSEGGFREIKFRVSDHALPGGYEQADFDIFPINGKLLNSRGNDSKNYTDGSWLDALEWLSREHGVKLPSVVKRERTKSSKPNSLAGKIKKPRNKNASKIKKLEQANADALLRIDAMKADLESYTDENAISSLNNSIELYKASIDRRNKEIDSLIDEHLNSQAYKEYLSKLDNEDVFFQSPAESESFNATSERYGGEEAYKAAKDAGQTDLNFRQWVQVRTPEFKSWFGDWENDPDNASKVINERTGEPLVVYHGRDMDFNIFDRGKLGANTYSNASRTDMAMTAALGHWFSTQDIAAETGIYSQTLSAFLNIRDPKWYGSLWYGLVDDIGRYTPLDESGEPINDPSDFEDTQDITDAADEYREEVEEDGHDGIILGEDEEFGGTSYVAFNSNQIKSATDNTGAFDAGNDNILYQGDILPRGFFDPKSRTIAVLKNADASTFVHELGHFFLEMQTNIAFSVANKSELTQAEQTIVDDMNTLLDWFGVKDLDTWLSMTTEEQREHHEKFARGFEAYLYEGKTPSEELRGVFARFRDWLKQVYQSLSALNVELTDDVRAVYGRLIAADDAIAETEQLNGMHPLFESAEQMGVDDESFSAYLSAKKQAAQEAQEYLQGKALRDMAFVRNARARKIRELKKQHKADFERAEIDARRSIMTQPVYRAWQFLNGRIDEENRVGNAPKEKFNKSVDPLRDSLFVAIAKLGGLNKDQLVSEWGLDKKDTIKSPVFGMPILRRTNGKTIDEMVEALSQDGYLPLDNTGKADVRDLEERFFDEMRGTPRYSTAYVPQDDTKAGDHVANPFALTAGRFDYQSLVDMGLSENIIQTIESRGMVRKSGGLHPDIVANLIQDSDGLPVYTSGYELVEALHEAVPPQEAIEETAYLNVLAEKGEVPDVDAFEEAADIAVHSEVRGRIIATEFKALSKAQGSPDLLRRAAANYAGEKIANAKVRDLRPSIYSRAEARAARAAERSFIAGDIEKAATEKRNQLVQNTLAREALKAREEMNKARKYLAKFNKVVKSIPIEYREQIESLLEGVDLSTAPSLKELDKRTSFLEFLREQEADGNPIRIDADRLFDISQKNYRDMTVSEMRGLVDAVKNLEHVGRLKNKLLTARKKKDYQAARDEIVETILENANGRENRKRTAATTWEKAYDWIGGFFWSHAKISSIARIMDGGKDGGVVWEYLIRPLNEAANKEASMMAEATRLLSEIMKPLVSRGNSTKKNYIGLGQLTKTQLYAVALNMGNAGNMQRLLDGSNWSQDSVMLALQDLSAAEWQAIQQVWDFVESYRPEIAALERRTVGVEPEWVDAVPLTVSTSDGQQLVLRGGYYPAQYDRSASFDGNRNELRADAADIMNAAQMAAHTRHSFTKSRAQAVKNRPMLLDLSVLYNGVNEIIHDLTHREAIMDVSKFLRSRTIDEAIISTYGRTVKNQFDSALQDIARGASGLTQEMDKIMGRVRHGVSVAGLGFNLTNAAIQVTGLFPAIARIGYRNISVGIAQYIASPITATRGAMELSGFMANRGRTRFRELNEVANTINGQMGWRKFINQNAYFLMLKTQQVVDTIVWYGAMKKAQDAGVDELTAISIADQAVLDTQGGGQIKDLSAIERGGATAKLFTVFYSYMNTMYNMALTSSSVKQSNIKKAMDLLNILIIPTLFGAVLKSAITPGEDDEELMDKLAKEQLSFIMGLFVGVRELSSLASLWGDGVVYDYQGSGGTRIFADTIKLAKQADQGEIDDPFIKAAVNASGSWFGLPAAQINRTIKGYKALKEDETDNPAALLFGYEN